MSDSEQTSTFYPVGHESQGLDAMSSLPYLQMSVFKDGKHSSLDFAFKVDITAALCTGTAKRCVNF